MLQETVWLITLVLMTTVLGAFVFVAVNASKPKIEYASVQASAYGVRKKLFWLLLIACVLLLVLTTRSLPYAHTHNTAAAGDIEIDVVGRQWSWQLSTSRAKAGQTVVFNITSDDVNHGLGIYDSDSRLLAQTQAMPKYTNRLRIRFDEPGDYRLMCMEYCGVAHHGMIAPFTVTAAK